MTEENRTTATATQTPVTDSEGINSLFIPLLAQLCETDLVCPSITSVNAQKIEISGLPHISARDINDSAISAICHAFQHFYRDGDYVGKKAIKKKHAAKEPLRNNAVRIAFGYTMSYSDGIFTINFMMNNARQPINLRKTDPLIIHQNNVKKNHVRKYGSNYYLAVPMSKSEIRHYENMFSAQCAQEIQHFLNHAFLAALCDERETGKANPDYYSKHSLQNFASSDIAV